MIVVCLNCLVAAWVLDYCLLFWVYVYVMLREFVWIAYRLSILCFIGGLLVMFVVCGCGAKLVVKILLCFTFEFCWFWCSFGLVFSLAVCGFAFICCLWTLISIVYVGGMWVMFIVVCFSVVWDGCLVCFIVYFNSVVVFTGLFDLVEFTFIVVCLYLCLVCWSSLTLVVAG